MIRKRKLAVVAVAMMMLVTIGCNGLDTAAKVMKTYRIALATLQDAEIGAHQSKFIADPAHVAFQAKIEKLANYGALVDTALLASDKATVVQNVKNAEALITQIETNDITAIGNPTTRAEVEAAVAGLSNLVQQVLIALGAK